MGRYVWLLIASMISLEFLVLTCLAIAWRLSQREPRHEAAPEQDRSRVPARAA